MSFVPSVALCISCSEHSGPASHGRFAGTSNSSICVHGRGNPRCSNAVLDDSAGIPGRTPSIDKCAAEACVHDVFYADLFLWIDFGSELTDLHMGPWEHTPPRRLKPRRGPIPLRGALSPIGHCALTLLLSLPYRPLLPEHTS